MHRWIAATTWSGWTGFFSTQGYLKLIMAARPPGHHDNGDVPRMRLRRDLLPHDRSAHNRQSQVQKNHVGRVAVQQLKGLQAVASLENPKAGQREYCAQHLAKGEIVFDDEHGAHDSVRLP
jgi:hypothetical protein